MVIVADSGSTKTAWAVGVEGRPLQMLECEGLNPYFTPEARYKSLGNWLRGAMVPLCPTGPMEPVEIYFYGAGCGTREKQQLVARLLKEALPEAKRVEVEGDLLGACRALYGKEAGVTGILGTGSNACYYDGRQITKRMFSTGYLLGDEGSGNHIGRKLLKGYLTQQMPETLREDFRQEYPMSEAQFLEQLYHQPNPNRFLASLAPFAGKHREEPYMQQVLEEVMEAYMVEQVLPVIPAGGCELRAVGGIAAHFGEELKAAAGRHGIHLGETLERPLERLGRLHVDGEW